jgi:hypothetical protein
MVERWGVVAAETVKAFGKLSKVAGGRIDGLNEAE